MSEVTYRYKIVDKEEGDSFRVNYISRSCMCFGECNNDTLEVFEDLDDTDLPYRMEVEGSDMKYFIMSLLDGSLGIEKLK